MTTQRAAAAALVLGLVMAACGTPASPTHPTPAAPVTAASGAGMRDGSPAGAAGMMVTLCHAQDGHGYRLLTMNGMAEAAHRAHGDAAVGEPVPGHPGAIFGAGCDLVTLAALIDVRSGTVGTFNWAGQSVTTPPGGPFNNIRFNWYTFSGTPTAFGRLYLLTQEYLGLPGNLGPATPGFVARSESIADNVYRFAPGVTLNGGTQYWFYTDTQGSFVTSFFGSTYPGGDLYVTGVPTLPFHKALGAPGIFLDANFTLSGAAVTMP